MPPPNNVDLSPVRHLFPHVPESAFAKDDVREVTLLIGNNFLSLHPFGGQNENSVGNLRALQSNFGSGWIVCGAHHLLDSSVPVPKLSANAANIVHVNRCEVSPILPTTFWQGESLGVMPKRRCTRCTNCAACSDKGLLLSRQDQEDFDCLKSGVKLENGQVHVEYKFKIDPWLLPNNRSTAIKIAEKLEKRLIAEGHHEYYNSELAKYLERGAAIVLSKEELESWQGPTNYISHHGVEQDSVTTPLRIVTNSSLKNGGRSLNDCLISGPNSINSMFVNNVAVQKSRVWSGF